MRRASICKRALWILGVYLFALLLPMGFDHFTELLHIRPYDYRDAWYHGIFKAGFWYQWLVTASPRKPRLHYVRVVMLRPWKEPGEVMGQNLCGERGQRAFTASLLRKLEGAHPAIIVLDKWYAPSSCPPGDPGTGQLREAIAEVSRNIPIVLGLNADTESDIEKRSRQTLSRLKGKGFRSDQLLAVPRLRFEESNASGRISYGVVTLNYDVRKIPLTWPVYGSENEVGRQGYPEMMASLALAAAREYDPQAAKGLTRHPFTSFLSERELRPYSAIDLICGRPGSGGSSDWRTCLSGHGDRQALADLQCRVVIVGEDNPDLDFYETPIGGMPGVSLQANYVESLLDDRYLRPASTLVIWALSAGWFALIEAVFHWFSSRPLHAVWVALGVTAFLAMLLYVVAVVNLGFYLALWPTGVVAVGLRSFLAFVLAGRSVVKEAVAQ
jgi:CHASE2 domain